MVRYHGNYCGPNWSAGKHQSSVIDSMRGIDEFDESCRVHDSAYAAQSDLLHADLEFAKTNFGHGVKRTAAAAAVGLQALFRAIDKNFIQKDQDYQMSLRGSQPAKSKQKPNNKLSKPQMADVQAPAVLGSVFRGGKSTTISKSSDSIALHTTVCIGRPAGAVQSTVPELIALQYLNPVSVGNDEVQNMARVYQHYQIAAANIHFRPFQGTSAGGEVMIVADSDPNFKPVNTSTNSTFYQRALATEHSLLTPIWCPAEMQLPVDTRWKVCDNANSTTLEEFASGVVFIYADGTTNITGFLVVELDIRFKGLRFNPRPIIYGSYQGMGVRTSVTTTIPVLNADVVLIGTGFTTGDIYAIQMSTTNATFGGVATASTLLTISSGSGTTGMTLTGSQVLYARASSSTNITLYLTYDAAVGGDTSDKLIYAGGFAAGSTFPCVVLTQLRNTGTT